MSDREMYLGAMAGSYEGELPPPNTRSLKWMAKILGADIVTEPVQSAEEAYLKEIYENGGGGGVTVEALTVTANDTYTAPSGKAYSPVTVNVPSVTVEALSVTENDTYTAPSGKAYSPVTVNVAGIGPIWSEFTATASASNARDVFQLLFPTAQPGDSFIVICQMPEADYVENQLLYGVFLKDSDNSGIVLFVRYKNGSHDAQRAVNLAIYDLSVSVGDRYIICEVI